MQTKLWRESSAVYLSIFVNRMWALIFLLYFVQDSAADHKNGVDPLDQAKQTGDLLKGIVSRDGVTYSSGLNIAPCIRFTLVKSRFK
jgi:hypothetical protein